jgi:hypothetical protein
MKNPLHRPFAEAIAEFYHGEWAFTGTRAGMNPVQTKLMRRVLEAGKPLILRHGGSFGADYMTHGIWRELGLPMADVWPADEKRAELFRGQKRVVMHPVMPPLDRNVEMVKRATFVVGAPHTNKEEQRSGTWQTLRYALSTKKPTLIVWPDNRLTLYFQDSLKRLILEDE